MDAVILAGGFGTRLKSIIGDKPKPMVEVLDKPALEWQILNLNKAGIKRVFILVHYNYQYIIDYFGDGKKWNIEIIYHIEKNPRGTAGALSDVLAQLKSEFFVIYGDTYFDIDLLELYKFHKSNNSCITLVAHPNSHPHDSDILEVDDFNKVINIHAYPHSENTFYRNIVNAALYLINKDVLINEIPSSGKFDLAKDTFPILLKKNVKIYAYITQEYIKDLGTPERLKRVHDDIKNGITDALSLRNKRKAIFLDRDGTIIEERNYINKLENVVLIDNSANAIKLINQAGYLSICITNQPVIARGELSFTGLNIIHNKLEFDLGKESSYLDRIYFCPHHPDSGFENEVKELKIECGCRKPNIDLILKAKKEFNIDMDNSWFIGDTTTDILTGIKAGLKTILVKSGYGGNDFKFNVFPDFVFNDLFGAVNWILNDYTYTKNYFLKQIDFSKIPKIILIAGLARSGKSTASKILYDILKEKKIKTHIISLDGWIKDFENRKPNETVITRYNLDLISILIEKLKANDSTFNYDIPIYDRLQRKSINKEQIKIDKEDVIIFEGVPALMNSKINKETDLRIYIEIDEFERKNRLKHDYLNRGFLENEFESLYKERETDEHIFIRESKKNANFILKLSNK